MILKGASLLFYLHFNLRCAILLIPPIFLLLVLFFLILNRFSLLARRGEALQLSNFLVILYHYRTLALLWFFFLRRTRATETIFGDFILCTTLVPPHTGEIVRRTHYLWLNIIWTLYTASPGALPPPVMRNIFSLSIYF